MMTQRGRCRKFTQINASGGQQPFISPITDKSVCVY